VHPFKQKQLNCQLWMWNPSIRLHRAVL